MRIARRLCSVLVLALVLSACRTSPIYNVTQGLVPTNQTTAMSGKLIAKALTSQHWKLLSNEPGKIIASIQVNSHTATINVQFDDKGYTIKYLKSKHLKYDAAKKIIHKTYNLWIGDLEGQIDFYLANPGAAKANNV
jgi:uncharacterized protein YcfL